MDDEKICNGGLSNRRKRDKEESKIVVCAKKAFLIRQHNVKYKGQQVKECLKENVSVFQDGYIRCGLVENLGCEKCYKEFEEKMKKRKTNVHKHSRI